MSDKVNLVIAEERIPLASLRSALQREAAHVNDLNGVVAFCAGVFAEVLKCRTIEDAKTCAEMGACALEEHHRGLWSTGRCDDPANWRERGGRQ